MSSKNAITAAVTKFIFANIGLFSFVGVAMTVWGLVLCGWSATDELHANILLQVGLYYIIIGSIAFVMAATLEYLRISSKMKILLG